MASDEYYRPEPHEHLGAPVGVPAAWEHLLVDHGIVFALLDEEELPGSVLAVLTAKHVADHQSILRPA